MFRARVSLVAISVMTGACTGYVGGGASEAPLPAAPSDGLGPTVDAPPLPPHSCPAATPRRVRRLSLVEYGQAVRALVGPRTEVFSSLLPDPQVRGFDNDADALVIATGRFEELAAAAEQIAGAADIAGLSRCPLTDAVIHNEVPGEACAERFGGTLGRRAYGRPLTGAERARLGAVYRTGAMASGIEAGLRLVLEAVLQSPLFLYRTELGWSGDPATSERAVATDVVMGSHEVARQLAFVLTGGPPDPELDRAADQGALTTRAALRQHAVRLLDTPAARAQLTRFLRSWLGLQDVRKVAKVQALTMAAFSEVVKRDADLEVGLFIDHALGKGGGTWAALFAPTRSFVSRELQVLHDQTLLDRPPAEGFGHVRWKPELRRGVVSLPGWLARHSPPHRSSPVERGLAVRSHFFCQSLPQPPADVLLATVDAPAEGKTTRARFEEHVNNASCRACHALIDPIGFGLENMDALGRHRTLEAGLPVDSQGSLPGTDVDGPFNGPAELAEKLLGSRAARDCFVHELYQFLEGRDDAVARACELAPLQDFFGDPERKIVDLVVEMVARDNFADRRAEP